MTAQGSHGILCEAVCCSLNPGATMELCISSKLQAGTPKKQVVDRFLNCNSVLSQDPVKLSAPNPTAAEASACLLDGDVDVAVHVLDLRDLNRSPDPQKFSNGSFLPATDRNSRARSADLLSFNKNSSSDFCWLTMPTTSNPLPDAFEHHCKNDCQQAAGWC